MNLNLSQYKSAGVFIEEIEAPLTPSANVEVNTLYPFFSRKGIFNRPVLITKYPEFVKMYGERNQKLEHKGSYAHKMAQVLLDEGPILAINLLKVDETYNGPDVVNYAAMSLDANTPNPAVRAAGKYGVYDYLANNGGIHQDVYGSQEGDTVPFVGKVPYAGLFDRTKFWIPSATKLMGAAAQGLATGDTNTFESTNLLNFANIGTQDISILVFKPETVSGMDITVRDFYGSEQAIPYGFMRPGDLMSDYFLTVIAVKGDWTNYPFLGADALWQQYFSQNGVFKNRINQFLGAEGIELVGSWTGSIIPNFIDKLGRPNNLVDKINASTDKTGVLAAFNDDAVHVLGYDKNGLAEDGEQVGQGCWYNDIDGNNTMNAGEAGGAYLVDMVGHGLQAGFKDKSGDGDKTADYLTIDEKYVPALKGRKIVYLETRDSLASDIASEVRSSFTAKVGSKNVKYEYAFIYNADTQEIYLKIDNADKLETEFAGTFKVTSKNRKDSDLTSFESNIKSDGNALLISTLQGGDFIEVTLSVDNSSVELSYESPEETALCAEFGNVKYGKYLVLLVDGVNVLDADVYALRHEPVTTKGRTSYKATFTQHTSNIPVKRNGNNYIVTYPISGPDAVTYTIPTTAPTKENAKGAISVKYNVYGSNDRVYGVNFLSYNYYTEKLENIVSSITAVKYFKDIVDSSDVDENGNHRRPVASEVLNMFICTSEEDANVLVKGNLINNIAFQNKYGVAMKYNTIPGLARITDRIFVQVDNANTFTYNGQRYLYDINNGIIVDSKMGVRGFYLYTASEGVEILEKVVARDYVNAVVEGTIQRVFPRIGRKTDAGVTEYTYENSKSTIYNNGVKIDELCVVGWENENGTDISGDVEIQGVDIELEKKGTASIVISDSSTYDVKCIYTANTVTKQLSLNDDTISSTLKFIPLKGLKIQQRHMPGYDKEGLRNLEAGVEKIYSVLLDDGIWRGLTDNDSELTYRYVVDSMGFGVKSRMGGKAYLTQLAMKRQGCTAVLSVPSVAQFDRCESIHFCDTYNTGTEIRPSFNTKWVAMGGNPELYPVDTFSLPTEGDGAKFAAAFFPYLRVSDGSVLPPAAHCANALRRKFNGGDPWGIVANMNGILSADVVGVEYNVDQTDRDWLEPMGIDCIINDNGRYKIYGNTTCFGVKNGLSPLNKLHVRENTNTLEAQMRAIMKNFNFLYNTPQTRAQITMDLTEPLTSAQKSGAIASFDITCDENNNTGEVITNDLGIVEVYTEHVRGMEKILTRLTIDTKK